MILRPAAAALLALASGLACAQTPVDAPWVRGTVAQQTSTSFYARITSAAGGTVVAVTSPIADAVEIHEMRMDGGVMQMRALAGGLKLPPGKAVELTPGGIHVMLMGLKKAVQPGERVPLTLTVEGADGKRERVEVLAAVRPLGAR